ncbi:MAG: ATP-binding cassette domain-containing protein [Lachnospiraceae bacterium]|nr:ATP-binding cassette domain-containing protein [Lachnospiraceae bacterium]
MDKFLLDLNFETDDEILGLIGASGSGKSMTLKCIAGIEKPDEGIIVLNDRALFDSENNINLKPQERRIGYLFQSYALFPQMTVRKNILVSVNKTYDKVKKRKKVDEIIDLLGLNGLEEKFPSEISGGQQQRVAFARIIVNEPEFLLLDEPFSALDAFLRWNIAKELKGMIKSLGKKAIFVTHNINEVYYLCNNAIALSEGKEIEKNSVKELIDNPKTEIVKKMVEYSDFSRSEIDKL